MSNRDFPLFWNEPVMQVKHSDLQPVQNCDSKYRKICPKCGIGALLVYRNQQNMVLEEYDCCVLCGQQVKYVDINEMRADDCFGQHGFPEN